LLKDCIECLNVLQECTGFSRVHVIGVSWGGKLAMALRRFAPARVRALSLVAPGLFPLVDLALIDKVRVGLSIIAAPRARFEIPLNEPGLFTSNLHRQAFIREDPLKLTQVTTGFLMASRRLDRYAVAIRKDAGGCLLRVFLAGNDRIIDNHRTREFVRRLGWPCRTIVEYPDAQHTLEFEPDPELYYSDLVEWVTDCERANRNSNDPHSESAGR
jgi:alpha-beta hydrolase superfamily lysophospholipase